MVSARFRRSFPRIALYAAILSAVLAGACTAQTPPSLPAPASVLFWSQAQREKGFPAMEAQFPTHVVRHGDKVRTLAQGEPLRFQIKLSDSTMPSLADYMTAHKTAGLFVLQHGVIRTEAYGLGFGGEGRWTSFSVAKSFTSTLVGAAVRDGYIRSVDAPITDYLPELKGSGYDGVSIRQVLTMTSGVRWNEDYTDPHSDVAQMFVVPPDPGVDRTLSYMRRLPRAYPPGTHWDYKTGETNLIGVLVARATHMSLADYLSAKIWVPFGMERDAVWMVDERGQEQGGCCISVTVRDYARMGLFMLQGARANGAPVLPDGWLASATHQQAATPDPTVGYGFQWWTHPDGSYDARGIFGQMIYVDPARDAVVVIVSAWPHATDKAESVARAGLISSILAGLDHEAH